METVAGAKRSHDAQRGTPLWAWLVPVACLCLALVSLSVPIGIVLEWLCLAALVAAVVATVHHVEVVAHRIGEPFGTLFLAISVTIIEVGLIVTVTMAGGAAPTLARDTIFSVIMITCNGLVGLSLLVGALRHREQAFHVLGANAILATLIAVTTLSLVLPGFTISSPGPTYTRGQLSFVAVASIVLWGSSVLVQTSRHREYFLPVARPGGDLSHLVRPGVRRTLLSFVLAWVGLSSVVLLAHGLAPAIERTVEITGVPKVVVSIAIATLTLLPEAGAALRAAWRDQLQTSLNLALGSALASIGLTIPAVAVGSILLGTPMVLGLAPKELILLALTFGVVSITLVAGRTHVLQGIVHLVIFGAFLVFSVLP